MGRTWVKLRNEVGNFHLLIWLCYVPMHIALCGADAMVLEQSFTVQAAEKLQRVALGPSIHIIMIITGQSKLHCS